MRAITDPVLVLRGEAQTLPGQLWTLCALDGTERTFLFDSMFEASIFASYWKAQLAFEMPAPFDPRRAMDYSNIQESMHVPYSAVGVARDGGGDARRTRPMPIAFDHLRSGDLVEV